MNAAHHCSRSMETHPYIAFFVMCLMPWGSANGQLLVTEIQSNQSATAPAGAGDYWELTNFGNAPVSLGNFKWDDDHRTPSDPVAATIPAGTSIAAGESIIFTLATPAVFRTWWSLPSSVQVVGPAGPGLGKGDAISLFNASGAEVLFFSYAAGGFTKSNGSPSTGDHAGLSAGGADSASALIWDPTSGTASPRYTFAAGGNFGTYTAATGTDRGSPGVTNSSGVAPTVDFSASATHIVFGQSVTFTASASNAMGTVVYQWNFGDGQSVFNSGAVVVHRYVHGGSFTVAVTATAANGAPSATKSGYITVSGFSSDSDADGLKDGLEYFFATDPNSATGFDNLPRVAANAGKLEFQFSRLANVTGVTGVLQTSADLVDWSTAISGLDFEPPAETSNGNNIGFSYGLPGTGPSPAGQSVDYLTTHTEAVAGAALGGLRVVNHGMVGVGRISGDSLDQFGETMGACSGLAISGWAYDSGSGNFSGTFQMLPDRGYNSSGAFSNYAARIHRLDFTFKPYNGTAAVAQGQVVPVYQGSSRFTYQDGALTKFTTGLNPTGTGNLLGQTVGTAVAANGPGGSQQALLSFDAEALQMLPDGSGFVSDEYGVYLARFDVDKKITGITQLPEAARPHRPFGTLNFDGSTAPTNGRRDNQGLEGLSITPDGTRLFALMQSGLVQDIGSTAGTRANTRLFVFNITGPLVETPQLVGEYVVKLPRYDSNGNGSAINRTANQSEIVAIGPQQFLMLPEDGNGFGSGSTAPGVYKCVQLVDFASATNILGQYDAEGAAVSPAGILNPAITAAASRDIVNLLDPADHARFGINTNNFAPDAFTLQEKLEGMALVPDLSTPAPDDFFLFVANDNDFQSSQVKMLNSSGLIQNFGDGRVDVGNGKITNDAVFYVYRISIGPLNGRYYRMKITED
jgi:hypothetical protein